MIFSAGKVFFHGGDEVDAVKRLFQRGQSMIKLIEIMMKGA